MKQGEIVVTVTKSVTLTSETETVETIKIIEMVGKDGKLNLIKRENLKTSRPLNLWRTVFDAVA